MKGRYDMGYRLLSQKKIKLGVKMVEFSDGFLDLDARWHKAYFIC
jgi:hypothetical protein